MPALGDEFKSAREARGLSLSDVAERLHIRSVYLAAIEDEDWKTIGPPVYVRGFMRTYARFLGLDAEALVARFSASAGTSSAAPATARTEERVRSVAAPGERARPSWIGIVALLVAVAVVAYVGYAYVTGGKPLVTGSTAAASPEPETSASAAAVADVPPLPTPKPKRAAKPARGLSVRVTETSWLRVTVDGTVALEGTFPAGTAKRFQGKDADVRVGNAGGVALAVNGRPVGPLGAPGEVAERHLSLSGE